MEPDITKSVEFVWDRQGDCWREKMTGIRRDGILPIPVNAMGIPLNYHGSGTSFYKPPAALKAIPLWDRFYDEIQHVLERVEKIARQRDAPHTISITAHFADYTISHDIRILTEEPE